MVKIYLSGLFSLALCAFTASGQAVDYCKQLKKEATDNKTFAYAAPFDSTALYVPIKISRNFSIDPELDYDNFSIAFYVSGDLQEFFKANPTGQGENDVRKFVVEFDDKSKYTVDSASISYESNNDNQLVIKSVFVNIEEANVQQFSTKNIAKYTIGGIQKTITPDSAMAYKGYIECMKGYHKVTTPSKD